MAQFTFCDFRVLPWLYFHANLMASDRATPNDESTSAMRNRPGVGKTFAPTATLLQLYPKRGFRCIGDYGIALHNRARRAYDHRYRTETGPGDS